MYGAIMSWSIMLEEWISNLEVISAIVTGVNESLERTMSFIDDDYLARQVDTKGFSRSLLQQEIIREQH